MTSQVRDEILRTLSELSECCPEVRFGQLIANLSYLAKGPTNEAIWDLEDEELLAAARKHLKERRNTEFPPPNEVSQPSAQTVRRG